MYSRNFFTREMKILMYGGYTGFSNQTTNPKSIMKNVL